MKNNIKYNTIRILQEKKLPGCEFHILLLEMQNLLCILIMNMIVMRKC